MSYPTVLKLPTQQPHSVKFVTVDDPRGSCGVTFTRRLSAAPIPDDDAEFLEAVAAEYLQGQLNGVAEVPTGYKIQNDFFDIKFTTVVKK